MFEFTYEHFAAHPRLISLLSGENLSESEIPQALQTDACDFLAGDGATREDHRTRRGHGLLPERLDPLQLYVLIVSVSYFHCRMATRFRSFLRRTSMMRNGSPQHKMIAREVIARYVEAELIVACSNCHRLLEYSAYLRRHRKRRCGGFARAARRATLNRRTVFINI